jgi:hypothetical protein
VCAGQNANHGVWVDEKFQVYFQLKNESGQSCRVNPA